MNNPQQIGPIEAKWRAEAAERRQRLMSMKTPAPKLKIVARCTDMFNPQKPLPPLWKRIEIDFNDHVVAWQLYQASKIMSPIPKFMGEWCRAHGTTVADMVGPNRKSAVSSLRHQLVYELYHTFKVSLPQLGRILGGRDHTTILNSLRRAEEILGERQ